MKDETPCEVHPTVVQSEREQYLVRSTTDSDIVDIRIKTIQLQSVNLTDGIRFLPHEDSAHVRP